MVNNQEKITLRPLRQVDGDYLDQISDEASFHFTREASPPLPQGAFPLLWDAPQRRIERLSFAIWANEKLVGEISLWGIDLDARTAQVTMGIAEKSNRSRGIGGQALHALLTYSFYSLGLDKITAETISVNLPAIRSLEKGGFRMTGIERCAVQIANLRVDRLHFAITAEEFSRSIVPDQE